MKTRQFGFSLVELMIGLAIVGILFFAGLPSITAWIQNTQLRSSAESMLSGMQLARAEAVKRNGQVEFVLTDEVPSAANVNALVSVTSGKNWMVRYYDTSLEPDAYAFVQGRVMGESTGKGNDENSNVSIAAGADTFAFNGLGRTTLAADTTIQITNPVGGECAPAGEMRCLNIVVSPLGKVKMCDPAVSDSSDSRVC